ncbi:hypothetical protein FJZ31_20440 [Candidatus Poribacteria bacterium]|nr:hypothetical protein [Candidatus Poribacteria bacterium]
MIYVIISATLAFTAHDNMVCLMGILAHGYEYATPENDWANLFHKYLPQWLVIPNPKTAKDFYRGETTFFIGEYVRSWLRPMIAWSFLVCLLFFMLMCINVLIRKQWVENERLAYPIIQIPLEMTSTTTGFFRNKIMWIGFGVAGFISLINGLNYLYPTVPRVPIKDDTYDLGRFFTDEPWNAIGSLPIRFYPFLIGLSFLIPLDLTFSTWFFFLFRKGEDVFGRIVGLYKFPGYPFLGEQATGSMMWLCVLALITGRKHFWAIFKRVIGLKPNFSFKKKSSIIRNTQEDKNFLSPIDDSQEPMRYRTAVIGLLLGFGLLMYFCSRWGMSLWLVVVFFGLYFAIATALTRMRAELGPPLHAIVLVNPQLVLISILGTRRLGTANLTMFSLFYWFNRFNRSHPMPHQLESFKISERTGASSRRLVWAMMLAMIFGAALTFWIYPYTLYIYGASTAGELLAAGWQAYDNLAGWLQYPLSIDYKAISIISGSFLFALFLSWMRMRFVWWPFHPAGYVLGVSSGTIDVYWFALFICWLIKLIVLRHGGVKSYRKVVPFFMGLVVGDFVVGCYWGLMSIIIKVPLYTTWF